MENKEKEYLANPDKTDDLVYFDTVYDKNVAHVNIGTKNKPYYLPQEMFKVTDNFREVLIQILKNGKM